jgi:LPS export ABC transporter protein LptC
MGLLVSCDNDIKEIEGLSSIKGKTPNRSFTNLEVFATDSGLLRYRIYGRYVDQYVFDKSEDNYMEIRDSLLVFLYDKKGDVESKISANYAIQFEAKKLIELSGNVVVKNLKENRTLKTEKLIWDQKEELIYTPEENYFRIDDNNSIITGYGLKADDRFEEYEYSNTHQQIKM